MDSVNLYATNAYGKVLRHEVTPSPVKTAETEQVAASQFQDLVKVNFNKFATLSPDQILAKIDNVRAADTNRGSAVNVQISSNNIVASELNNLRKVLTKQETEAQKVAVGKGNLVDLMTSSVQAEKTLSTITTVHNKLVEAWEKILSFNI